MNREKIRLAMAIVSGRYDADDMSADDWDTLGYDPYKFGYYGKPDSSDLKERAEDILLEAILDHGHGAAEGFLGGPPARLIRE